MSEDTTEETQGGREAGEAKLPIMNILGSDGTLRLVVPEGTEGAKLRHYEYKDSKTKETVKGSKWELVFKSLSGRITNIQQYDGDYGMNLMVTLTYDGGEDVISIGTETPFGEDFMKKLPNIKLEEFVTFSPFRFTDDRGKLRQGISITQGDEKIKNFFYDPEKKKNLNKYPDPEGKVDDYTKDDWKIYFMQARKFLIGYTEENFLPLYAHLTREKADTKEKVEGDEGF